MSVAKAIKAGELKINFGGVALGDSWISPEDYVLSWGPLLKDVSRLDGTGADKSNSLAEEIKQQIAKGQFENAINYWSSLEDVIVSNNNNVDFYNFLLDSEMDPLSVTAVELSRQHKSINRYSRYLSSRVSSGPSLDSLMNGVIKEKIKIIPKDVRWGGQSNQVFSVLSGDFMKPRIIEVDELLSLGVNVTVYNGQLDLICATKGTEAWVQKLKWEGLQTFTNTGRTPLFCGNEDGTKGFTKSYRNFHFYWILKAGHFTTNKVAIALVGTAAVFILVPFKHLIVFALFEIYTREMPLRKQSSEKLIRRVREWWVRIPAAPVQLIRPQ